MYSNHRGLERRAALALVLLAGAAWAHDADVIYVQLTELSGGGLEEAVTLTAGTLSQLAPIDADGDGALSQADLDARADAIAAGVWDQMPLEATTPCVRSSPRAILREGYVELFARFTCPAGPLSQDFRILRVLTTNYRVVLGRQADGEGGRAFAQGNVQRLQLRPQPQGGLTRPRLSFTFGSLAFLTSPDVVLLWLLLLLVAPSVKRAAGLTAALVAGYSIAAAPGLELPELVGAALVVGVGAGSAIFVLLKDATKWPVVAMALASVGDGLRAGAALTAADAGLIEFHLGRAVGLAVLALGVAPIARIIGRRPRLRRRAVVAIGCAALAALGFSFVQTLRTF